MHIICAGSFFRLRVAGSRRFAIQRLAGGTKSNGYGRIVIIHKLFLYRFFRIVILFNEKIKTINYVE